MIKARDSFFSSRFVPTRPSPLSPRSINPRSTYSQSTNSHSTSSPSTSSQSMTAFTFNMDELENSHERKMKPSVHSQRPIKATPFTNRNPDEQRERRRSMFLKKMEQSRDDKRWASRNDQIQRSNYFDDQDRFIRSRSASSDMEVTAPSLPEHPDSTMDTDLLFDLTPEAQDSAMLEIEEIAQYEMMELDALVTMSAPQTNRKNSLEYDDSDYDSFFRQFISTEEDGSMEIDQPRG